MTHVPNDQLTPGLWYIKTFVEPFYSIVSVGRMVLGPYAGELWVWGIDEEGGHEVAVYDDDQFIGPVPPPK